jgi:hypothetical protein
VKEKADLKVLLRLPDAATTEQVSAVFAALKLVLDRKSLTGKTPEPPPKATAKLWFKVASQPKPSFSYFANPASDTGEDNKEAGFKHGEDWAHHFGRRIGFQTNASPPASTA